MGRKKLKIAPLDPRQRRVTFSRRIGGLAKKAHELGILCDCQVALVVIDNMERCHTFSSSGDCLSVVMHLVNKDFAEHLQIQANPDREPSSSISSSLAALATVAARASVTKNRIKSSNRRGYTNNYAGDDDSVIDVSHSSSISPCSGNAQLSKLPPRSRATQETNGVAKSALPTASSSTSSSSSWSSCSSVPLLNVVTTKPNWSESLDEGVLCSRSHLDDSPKQRWKRRRDNINIQNTKTRSTGHTNSSASVDTAPLTPRKKKKQLFIQGISNRHIMSSSRNAEENSTNYEFTDRSNETEEAKQVASVFSLPEDDLCLPVPHLPGIDSPLLLSVSPNDDLDRSDVDDDIDYNGDPWPGDAISLIKGLGGSSPMPNSGATTPNGSNHEGGMSMQLVRSSFSNMPSISQLNAAAV